VIKREFQKKPFRALGVSHKIGTHLYFNGFFQKNKTGKNEFLDPENGVQTGAINPQL